MKKGERPPWIVPDALWARIEPLLPVVPGRADHPGRKRLDDRKVLCGILFVLYTGIPWEFLPQKLGFGSGMTCWRRLRDWNDAGVWQRLHESLLAELHAAGALDWSRAVIDGSHVRALKGGPKPDRARSTVPAPAPSTICSPKRTASRWRCRSPAETATTSPSSSR
jgi:transposase